MKVLIVDDEEHVREAIELSVDWAKYGIEERLTAQDGSEAMALLRLHKPAVLFCDMRMPLMDGPQLLQALREENEDTQIIVISGHDDFNYMQATIRAWGVDYLLKPFRKRDLEQALQRAIAAWREEESSKRESRETKYRVQQADTLLEEQRLAAFLRGEAPCQEGVRSMLVKLGLGQSYLSLILPRNRHAIVGGRFAGDAELFSFAIHNIAHEVLHNETAYGLCRLDTYQWAVLLEAGTERTGLDRCRKLLRRVEDAWEQTLGMRVLTGLAEMTVSPEGLPAAVGSARSLLLQSQLVAASAPGGGIPAPRLSDQELLLDAAVHGGDKTYAAAIIAAFVQSLRSHGALLLQDLQAYTLEANLMLERCSRKYAVPTETAELSLPLWISDLEEWERLLRQEWWRLIEGSGNERSGQPTIESMRAYMHEHYHEEISLSTLSERFHFSPQYIAKKFKEVYNTTVVTYLTELRMDKARSLLQHTGWSVQEIAERLGYADENYFGKVFKRHTGCSPIQYRKQLQGKGVPT